MFEKAMTFFKEVRAELGKISWPTREELRETTVVVIVTVIIFTGFIAVVDQVFNVALKEVIKLM